MEGRPGPGKRQAAVDRTRTLVLEAARDLVASPEGAGLSLGAVARRAGVSRLTIYNQFGSREGLLRAVAGEAHRRTPDAAPAPAPGDAREELRRRISTACIRWASNPALFRGLSPISSLPVASAHDRRPDEDRRLAERLASADQLRPGCSLKEAEDVIGALTSFAMFDRLHGDGRRSAGAVAEILMRLAAAILS